MTTEVRVIVAAHLLGNALLLLLGYFWLGTSESTMARLAWTALSALILLSAALTLHGATMVYFAEPRRIRAACFVAMRNLLALLVFAAVVWMVYLMLARWQAYSRQPAFQIASWLTLHLRKPVKPESVMRIFDAVLWLVRWAVLPVVLFPRAAAIAERGWRGFIRGCHPRLRRWRYWVAAPVLTVAAFWVPLALLRWIPTFSNFWAQFASFTLRFGVAYLCFVAALLALSFFTSPGRPAASQPDTVSTP